MPSKDDEVLPERPPFVGMTCFREAILHGTDTAVMQWIKSGKGPNIEALTKAKARLMKLVDQIEEEQL